jgi:hypothetical protein
MLKDEMIQNEGKIVHGKVQDPKTKKMIEHAWIELGTMVIDPTISDGMIRKTQYYRELSAAPKKSYTFLEAVSHAFKKKKGLTRW